MSDAANAGDIAKGIANIKKVLAATESAGASAATKAGAYMINALRDAVSGPSPSSPGEPPGMDTGNLQASFDAENGTAGASAYVDIFNTAEYAGFLEFGTSDMDARPYFRTTIEANVENIGGFLADEIIAKQRGAI